MNRGSSSLQSTGFSLQGLLLLRSIDSRCWGFSSCGVQAHRLGCFLACGIFSDRELNLGPLQWQATLNHWTTREVPLFILIIAYWCFLCFFLINYVWNLYILINFAKSQIRVFLISLSEYIICMILEFLRLLWSSGWLFLQLFHVLCSARLPQPRPVLCDPMDCSPPGSLVHGILQTRILEWVAVPSSRGSSWPRDRTHVSYVSCIGVYALKNWLFSKAECRVLNSFISLRVVNCVVQILFIANFSFHLLDM